MLLAALIGHVFIPYMGKRFYFPHTAFSYSDIHAASYAMGIVGYFPWILYREPEREATYSHESCAGSRLVELYILFMM
jgi:hypothetical protein